jgi:beta-fructofuranosidase
LDVKLHNYISPHSALKWGINFECASFFTVGETDYILVGVEETEESTRHSGHCLLWLSGRFVLEQGLPRFRIDAHGLLDGGVLYAAHIFRDAEDRLIQLGWADETAKKQVVREQGWAVCLGHPREIFEIVRPLDQAAESWPEWQVDGVSGTMKTLGIRPAPQVDTLRTGSPSSLEAFKSMRSSNYEIQATFCNVHGTEKFTFNVLQSPDSDEVTKVIFDVQSQEIVVDRSKSSLAQLGASTPDTAPLRLVPGENLVVRIFVDVSMVEVYANDRFAVTSRVYPSLGTSTAASYDFGGFDEGNVSFECWQDLRNAWPGRESGALLPELNPLFKREEGLEKDDFVRVSEMAVEMTAVS